AVERRHDHAEGDEEVARRAPRVFREEVVEARAAGEEELDVGIARRVALDERLAGGVDLLVVRALLEVEEEDRRSAVVADERTEGSSRPDRSVARYEDDRHPVPPAEQGANLLVGLDVGVARGEIRVEVDVDTQARETVGEKQRRDDRGEEDDKRMARDPLEVGA